jgi:hypothetical protein
MPPGKKAPPQQSSLTELWGNKRKKEAIPGTPTKQSKTGGDDATAKAAPIKTPERSYAFFPHSSRFRVLSAEETPNTAGSPKHKQVIAATSTPESTYYAFTFGLSCC